MNFDDIPFPVIFFVIYAIYALATRKKAAEKKKQEAIKQALAKQGKQAGSRQGGNLREARAAAQGQVERDTYRNKIEDVLRNAIEQADRELSGSGSSQSRPATPALSQSSGTKAAADDPFAFHSLMDPKAKNRVDYDATATDYDVAAVDYDKRSDAFGFRQAVNEPVEKEYHLTGFSGFHTAHALSSDERRRAAGDDAYNDQQSGGGFTIGTSSDLRRAIIIQEVLGKPKCKQG